MPGFERLTPDEVRLLQCFTHGTLVLVDSPFTKADTSRMFQRLEKMGYIHGQRPRKLSQKGLARINHENLVGDKNESKDHVG